MKILKLSVFIFIFALININISYSQSKLSKAQNDKVIKKLVPILKDEFKNKNLTLGNSIFIRIIKTTKNYDYGILELWVKGNNVDTFSLFKKYPICYYSGGTGPKKKQGDCKTPEGFYYVNKNRINQNSSYHRAFNIGYPNNYDRLFRYTGGYIMIHGACCSIGCIAMTDEIIEEIWTIGITALNHKQAFFRVHIFPFYMTDKKMTENKNNENIEFWKNLKEGYDYFEKNKKPPNVTVKAKYIFK